jgi:predicted esterase
MNNFKSITSKVFIIIIFISYGFAQNKYAIVLPEEYNKTQTYPLFIVFHGGNGNMKSMMKWWKSERLSEEFIVAYMEASTLDNPPNRWGWRNLTHERQNIKSYYDIIKKDYCIKENQVYVGGFSLGGKVSIDLALNQIIPVKGFISLNHGGGTTRFFTDENVKKIAKKNIKGVLVSGEKDYRYKKETAKIKAMFNSHGLQYLFIENEGIGHYAPDNFRKVLNTYLDFIVH